MQHNSTTCISPAVGEANRRAALTGLGHRTKKIFIGFLCLFAFRPVPATRGVFDGFDSSNIVGS